MATQDDPSDELEFPPLIFQEEPAQVSKPPASDEEEKQCALEVVRRHHARIATTLNSIWAYPECGDYLQRLVFDGADRADQIRDGFKPEVLDAILVLAQLHKLGVR